MLSQRIIDTARYRKIELLGRGGNGAVYSAVDTATGDLVAIKSITLNPHNPRQFIDLIREIDVMDEIHHPTIHQMIGYCPANPATLKDTEIITQFMPNKSLDVFIATTATYGAPQDWNTRVMIILFGVAFGMNLLHKHNPPIIHRDLKPGNILLNANLEPCVSDFGLSKFLRDNEPQSMYGGTIRFMAPEILRSDSTYGTAVDVYAYGMLVFQLLMGELPFSQVPSDITFAQMILAGQRPAIREQVPLPFRELITACWDPDPDQRPTFQDILDKYNEPGFIGLGVDLNVYKEYRERMMKTAPITRLGHVNTAVVIPHGGKPLKRIKGKKEPRKEVSAKCAEALKNAQGDGMMVNVTRAAELFAECAREGDTRAQYELGLMFAHGVGVERDLEKAREWFKKCSKQGMIEADAAMAELFQGEEYLKRAVAGNDLNGRRLLVRELCMNGEGRWTFCDGFKSVIYLLENEFRPFDGHYTHLVSRAITESRAKALEFLASVKEEAKSDPVAQYLIGILALGEIVDEPYDVFLIRSFMGGYRPAFDTFCENQIPITKEIQKAKDSGPCMIIAGNEKLKRGREKDAITLWKKATEKCDWAPDSRSLDKAIRAVSIGTVEKKDIVKLMTFYADHGSGYAREKLGQWLVLGEFTQKDEIKGLNYLKMAFDDRNYRMLEPEFLKEHCSGFNAIE